MVVLLFLLNISCWGRILVKFKKCKEVHSKANDCNTINQNDITIIRMEYNMTNSVVVNANKTLEKCHSEI